MEEEKDFNFFNKKSQLTSKKKNPFIKMGITAFILMAGASAAYLYPKNTIPDTSPTYAKEQALVKSTPTQQVENLMLREEKTINSYYSENKKLLQQYSNYTQIVQALNYQAKYTSKYNANEKIFTESLENLKKDKKIIESMTHNPKKEIFSNEENLKVFKNWTDKNAYRQYIYAYQSIELNTDIKKDLEFLDKTQKEVAQAVKAKIKP